MESGLTVANSSGKPKEEPHKKEKANEGEDIISNLPESLISQILSFLPTTEDAVLTSVLSKKWIYRWTTINKLVLDDSVYHPPIKKVGGTLFLRNLTHYPFYSRNRRRRRDRDQQHFVNFVNRHFFLNGASMESISLFIEDEYDVSLVNTWLSSIFHRSAKHLEIYLHGEKIPFSQLSSHSLFNSISLEELLLMTYGTEIKIPTTHVHFGYLKSLTFSGIDFTVDSSDDHLSLSLPVLKMFKTVNCTWINAKGITVEAPLLETICIEQNLDSASDEPRSSAITFSVLHLKELTYYGYDISRTVILSDPSSAYNALAYVILNPSGDVVPESVSGAFLLLKQLSQMKCIKFYGAAVLTQPELDILPVFAKLSHLEIGWVTGEVLLGLLQKSPVLKTLVVKGISKFDQDLSNSVVVPECLASTFQVVKFEEIDGDEHELFLAKYFMENGMVLKRMSFSRFSESKVMEEFKGKLFSYKKAFSNVAVVDFSI